jgi:prepilin-type N-terminal cleavage/methylation domain-containing protein
MTAAKAATKRARGKKTAQAGFTLLEVLVALLVAMIGLIGTVAFQHTVLRAAAFANDAQIATQLATRAMEELNTRRTQERPFVDALGPIATGIWSNATYLDAQGRQVGARTATARWQMRTRITDLGPSRPYNLSVEISYALDSDRPKITRLDVERRKTW